MKTFGQFITECEYILEKYSDEHAHRKVWNHFIVHKKHGAEVQKHLSSGDHDKALEHMKSEVDKAKSDPKHPLSFEKSKRGFSGQKSSSDKESYHKELDNAVHGVHALATKDRRTKSAASKRLPMRVTGAGKAETTKQWKKTGAKDTTPKRDLEIHNPKNKKYGIGISQKKSGGSQLMSAGPEETHATIKHAAKKLAKSMLKSGKSREDASTAKKDIESRGHRISRAVKAMERGSRGRKDALKKVAQRHIDRMHDAHPELAKHIGSEASSGVGKYGKKVSAGSGRAEILLKNADSSKNKSAEVHDIRRRERAGVGGKLRAAMPKSDKVNKQGKTRTGNVKLDER